MEDESLSEQELQRFGSAHDMYDRLSRTLDQPSFDSSIVRAVTLQLIGAPSRSREVGPDVRGEIHLAMISDATANLSRFLSAISELAPQTTARLNGTATSRSGLLGSVAGGKLTPGPLLDDEVDLTMIERFDATDRSTKDALQQVLDTGSYSFGTVKFSETVRAPGSILLALNPKYELFDKYEAVGEQLNLDASVLAGIDLPLPNIRDATDPVRTDESALSAATARQYIDFARGFSPELAPEATAHVQTEIDRIADRVTREDTFYPFDRVRLEETLSRFALAHARLRLADRATRADTKRVVPLVEQALEDVSVFNPSSP